MEAVKAHLVAVWAPEGLECRSVGAGYIHAYIGPKFAIGAFCGDMAETFNAEVSLSLDDKGISLMIIMTDIDDRPRASRWVLIWWLAAVVSAFAVACKLTVHEGLLW